MEIKEGQNNNQVRRIIIYEGSKEKVDIERSKDEWGGITEVIKEKKKHQE